MRVVPAERHVSMHELLELLQLILRGRMSRAADRLEARCEQAGYARATLRLRCAEACA
jgi:hypothetical protein